MFLTRRDALAGAAGIAGLSLTWGSPRSRGVPFPIGVTAARPAQSPLNAQRAPGPLPPRTHNDIIAAFLAAEEEPGPEWPDDVRLFWMLVRCTPDELDFFDAFVDAAVARCPEALPGAEGARFLIALARPEPT